MGDRHLHLLWQVGTRMKPLKAEIDALREVVFTPLEQFGEFVGPDGPDVDLAYKRMFTAAIEAVDKARATRGFYTAVAHFGGPVFMGVGPFSTRAQAVKALEEDILPLGPSTFAVVSTMTPEAMKAKLADADTTAASKGDFAMVAQDVEAFKNGWDGKRGTRERHL